MKSCASFFFIKGKMRLCIFNCLLFIDHTWNRMDIMYALRMPMCSRCIVLPSIYTLNLFPSIYAVKKVFGAHIDWCQLAKNGSFFTIIIIIVIVAVVIILARLTLGNVDSRKRFANYSRNTTQLFRNMMVNGVMFLFVCARAFSLTRTRSFKSIER